MTRNYVSYVKRRAKRIKKEKGITHAKALNEAAKELGFRNWIHFIESNPRP